MRSLKEDTHQQQSALADYCRTGVVPENLTNVRKENLHHYRRLVFNIASDILESAYPITHSYLDVEVWNDLIKKYFSEHKCQTAQVWKMPLEFYDYCLQNHIAEKLNVCCLHDLLYFEWLELEVHTMEDITYPLSKEKGRWLDDIIVVNPEHKLVNLSYPVHTTAPNNINEGLKGNYFLLIYRERISGNVQFIDLSVLYTFILENLMNGSPMRSVLKEADLLFQINNITLLEEKAFMFFNDLHSRGFITGYKN
jgi:uncharacterized protein